VSSFNALSRGRRLLLSDSLSINLNALRITHRRHLIQRHLRPCNAYVCTYVGICVRTIYALGICRIADPSAFRADTSSLLLRLHRTFRFSCVILSKTRARGYARGRAAYACNVSITYLCIAKSRRRKSVSRSRKGSANPSRTDPNRTSHDIRVESRWNTFADQISPSDLIIGISVP